MVHEMAPWVRNPAKLPLYQFNTLLYTRAAEIEAEPAQMKALEAERKRKEEEKEQSQPGSH